MENKFSFRSAKISDAQAIAKIYNYYVQNTVITFAEEEVDKNYIANSIKMVQSLGLPYIVVEVDNKIVGYSYASKWREHSAYRFSVETTIYLAKEFIGKGIGKPLYQELIKGLKLAGVHRALACITLPYEPSTKFHESMGFVKVGNFSEAGLKFNRWLDVGFWQLDL